jgi:uncharacterized protein
MSEQKNNGGVCWFEIPAADPARAQVFYGRLLDWKFKSFDGVPDYWLISPAGGADGDAETKHHPGVGGALAKRQGPSPEGAGPVLYFSVDDIESTLNRLRELGGQVTLGKTLIAPEVGYFAMATDSESNTIAFWAQS